jgi:ABC-type transporter Mla subunit MlaD
MIPLALVALLGLWFLYPTSERVAQQAPAVPVPTETGALQFAQGLEQRLASLRGLGANGVEAANQISGAFGSLTAALQGITDQATAQTALPRLKEAASQVDKVVSSVDSLPADGRKALYGFVAAALPTINTLLDKVLAIPGVSAAIKPTVDELRLKLDSMAKQAQA